MKFILLQQIHSIDNILISNEPSLCDEFFSLEPNVGIVNVPDDRLGKLGVIYNSVKVVPASVSINNPRFLVFDLKN
jgi:hypothetical protein